MKKGKIVAVCKCNCGNKFELEIDTSKQYFIDLGYGLRCSYCLKWVSVEPKIYEVGEFK